MLDGDPHPSFSFELALLCSCSVSVVCCCIIIFTFVRFKALRKHPNSLVIARCVCDLLFYAQFIASTTSYFVGFEFSSLNCQFFAFWTEFFQLAADLYFLALCVDLRVCLSNPFTNYKVNTRLYHGCALVIAAVMGIIVATLKVDGEYIYGSDNYLTVCWIKQFNLGVLNVNPAMWALFYVPLMIVFFTAIICLVSVRRRISNGVPTTARTRLFAFISTLRYVVGLFPYWTLAAAILFALQLDHHNHNLRIAFAIIVGMRDAVVLLVWLWTNDISEAIELSQKNLGDTVTKDIDLSPALNVALKREIMFYTSAGVREAVALSKGAARLSLLRAQTTSTDPHALRSIRNFVLQRPSSQYDFFTFRTLLLGRLPRSIVESDTSTRTIGSAKSAPASRAAPSTSASSSAGAATATAAPASRGSKRRKNGRRGSLGAPLLQKKKSAPHLFAGTTAEAALQTMGVSLTPSKSRVVPHDKFLFQDFHEGTFQHVRAALGISNEDFAASLSETIEGNFSGGSSGAFMYFSKDRRFVVKTLTREEKEVLDTLVHEYCGYIRNNPDTLLTKFLGSYCITMYGKQIYFTVMTNMLHSKDRSVHETYDLKGSTVNRSAKPPSAGSLAFCQYCKRNFRVGKRGARCPARLRHPHVARQTLKDNDLKFKLRLGLRTETVIQQIRQDASFLRDHGIMDYSLLLGVHRARFKIHAKRHSTAVLVRRYTTGSQDSSPVPASMVAITPRSGGGAASDEESRRSYGSTASTTAPVTAPSNRSLPMVTPMGSTTPVPLAPIHAGDTEEEEEGADDVDLDLAGASPGGGGRPQATPATGAAPVAGEQHGAAPRGVVGHGDEALGASRRSISSSDRRGATASGTNTVLEVEVGQVRRTVVPSSGSDGADGGAGGGASARNRHLSRREFIPLPLETKDAGSEEAKGRESSFTTFRGPSYINEYHGGMQAAVVEGPEVYFLGIIDVLQKWNQAKRVERWFKISLRCMNPSGISAVEPGQYYTRFVNWIRNDVIAHTMSSAALEEVSEE